METTRLRVCFLDEAVRIGSGWRTVNVMVGRKIVHLCDDYGNRAKLSKETWREVCRGALPMKARKRKRRKA
jgi:hypothetical protein